MLLKLMELKDTILAIATVTVFILSALMYVSIVLEDRKKVKRTNTQTTKPTKNNDR